MRWIKPIYWTFFACIGFDASWQIQTLIKIEKPGSTYIHWNVSWLPPSSMKCHSKAGRSGAPKPPERYTCRLNCCTAHLQRKWHDTVRHIKAPQLVLLTPNAIVATLPVAIYAKSAGRRRTAAGPWRRRGGEAVRLRPAGPCSQPCVAPAWAMSSAGDRGD